MRSPPAEISRGAGHANDQLAGRLLRSGGRFKLDVLVTRDMPIDSHRSWSSDYAVNRECPGWRHRRSAKPRRLSTTLHLPAISTTDGNSAGSDTEARSSSAFRP